MKMGKKTKQEKIISKIQKIVEEEITSLMEKLKPGIKERLSWGFSDALKGEDGTEYKTLEEADGKQTRRVDIIYDQFSFSRTGVITFYTKSIATHYFFAQIQDLILLIKHEVGHLADGFLGESDKTGAFENDKFKIFEFEK